MLINCPECNKEVSDKAEICPNCGYKLQKLEPIIKGVYCPSCLDCGIKTKIEYCPYCHVKYKDSIQGTCDEVDNYTKNHPELKQAPEFSPVAYNKRINYVPYEYPTSNVPKCPTCGSTNLSKISNIGKAAKVGLFGIFGAGDLGKTWKCNSCGSKW
jgi:hypothetical protein